MKIPLSDIGKGLNRDLPPSELGSGYWNDVTNCRFPNGFLEKVGGIAAVFTTPAVIPYYLTTYTTSTSRFLIEAGIAKVYADDGTTQTQITRYIEPKTITAITRLTCPNRGEVTTSAAHGLTTGDTVTIEGAATGSTSIEVIDADHHH